MAIAPDTELLLIKSPIELDNNNQITFTSKSAQSQYFASLPHITIDNISYQRKDNYIRFPEHIDNILEYNYVMYRNKNYDNKYFYAFITRMEYVNDNMTNIYIKTDVFQTWQFDLEYKRSFVEREHVNDDTIGLHTIPEGLETGEYINNGDVGSISELTDLMIVVGLSDYSHSYQGDVRGKMVNNIYSGLQYRAYNTTTAGINELNDMILDYDTAGKSDSIITIFMAPKYLDPHFTAETTASIIRDNELINTKTINIAKNYSIGGYTPKNNKVKCFPYNYLLVTNNNGTSKVYKYELFDTTTNNVSFRMSSVLSTGCSIRIAPIDYNSVGETSSTVNNIEGIDLGKYPTCSWISDSYTNWLTQNSVNNASSIGAGLGQLVAGIAITAGSGGTASPVGLGLVATGATSLINSASNIYQNSLVPDSAEGNINNGDVVTASGNNTFRFYHMSIREEYARVIDDIFSRLGYKVNTTKVPNITGRRNWNYVKTIGANIEGYIPQEDMQEIKDMFNNGITLWHNTSTFLDYSQNNSII